MGPGRQFATELNQVSGDSLRTTVPGFERIGLIKALGVTISRRFSIVQHVGALLAGCAQTLFALRSLRQHCTPTIALQAVFPVIDCHIQIVICRLGVVGLRKCWWSWPIGGLPPSVCFVRIPYDASVPFLAHICAQADDKLFDNILHNDEHLLCPLLPPERNRYYSLRHRRHNLLLPICNSTLNNNNLSSECFLKIYHTLVSQLQQCNF